MYRLQNGKYPNDLSDLDDYIDVASVQAPTGDVYIDGVLTPNSDNENYTLSSNKQNAVFMGKLRTDFSQKATINSEG